MRLSTILSTPFSLLLTFTLFPTMADAWSTHTSQRLVKRHRTPLFAAPLEGTSSGLQIFF